MVSAGAGVTLLPRMAVATESRRAHLAVRPIADDRAFRTLALVWRPTSPLGPALAAARRDDPRELREDDLIRLPNRLPHCRFAGRGRPDGSGDGVDDFLQQRFGLGRRADLLRDVEADDPPPAPRPEDRLLSSSAASSAEPTAS